MLTVVVEVNIKDWDEGPADQLQTEVSLIWETLKTLTGFTYVRTGSPDHFRYAEFQVPKDKAEAFCMVVDWTTFAQAQIMS